MAPEMTREQWVEWYVASGMTREDAEEHVDHIEYAAGVAQRGEDR